MVGWVTARPEASSATSAMIATGWVVKASAAQITACARPVRTSRIRLSTRSASRPVSGASTARGTAAASRSPATANPPCPVCCRTRASVVAARKSPQTEMARPAATR